MRFVQQLGWLRVASLILIVGVSWLIVGSVPVAANNMPPSGDNPQISANGQEILEGTNLTVNQARILVLVAYCQSIQATFDILSMMDLQDSFSFFVFYMYVAPCQQLVPLLGEGLSPSSSAPISLGLQIVQGRGGEFKATKSFLGLNIQAATATVSSLGANDFSVVQDPSTGADTVAVYQGNVSVQPNNTSLQPVTLSTGQQVVVTKDSISPVTPIGSPPPSGGGSPPPPPPPPSGGPSPSGTFLQIAQALDTDHNNKIDDDEMKTADFDWTTNQMVAGTSFTISDDVMKQIFQLWETNAPIAAAGTSAASASPVSSLQVRSITARTLDTHSVRFVAEGQAITGIEAQVFDLSGKLVFDQHTTGTTLTFRGLGADGRPLANGVYLYIVSVRGIDGSTVGSEVRKLVLLR